MTNPVPMNSGNKSGRITKEEREYIINNLEKLTVEEIAFQISKNPDTVKQYIKKEFGNARIKYDDPTAREFNIAKSPLWKDIRKQFSEEELDTFLYNWKNIYQQFKNDIYATERMQIIEICRLECLLNRALTKMKDSSEVVMNVKKELDDEQRKEPKDFMKIDELQRMIVELYVSNSNFTKEYKDLLERKQSMLKEVRGNREQRQKRLEESRENVTSWIAKLVDQPELRKQLGIDMEKFRLAMGVELNRLSEYHQFMDGSAEQPILNVDTLKEDNI